jgi:hypothetical protein
MKSPSGLPNSDMLEDEEYNHSFKMSKLPIYDKAKKKEELESHNVSLNTQPDEGQQTQVKFMELKRFIFQLENIVEFSNDDASDIPTLNRMLEQCINMRLNLNLKNLTVVILRNVLKKVLAKVSEMNIQNVSPSTIDLFMQKEITQNLP